MSGIAVKKRMVIMCKKTDKKSYMHQQRVKGDWRFSLAEICPFSRKYLNTMLLRRCSIPYGSNL